MCSLPQMDLLAQELLKSRLNSHVYLQSKFIPGIWIHATQLVKIKLFINNFGERHRKKCQSFDQNTKTILLGGRKYIDLIFDLDYEKREVHLSMLGNFEKALKRFEHESPNRCQDQPHEHVSPDYGAKA